jgi:hypothetical protein
MEVYGGGPFSNEAGLAFLDDIACCVPAHQRREVLEDLFFQVEDRPHLLGGDWFPEGVVAAVAIVAACLPGSEGIRQELTSFGYEAAVIMPDGADFALSASALRALLLAAGRDGPWHATRTNPQDVAQARETTDQLAAILISEQYAQDQQLPLQL